MKAETLKEINDALHALSQCRAKTKATRALLQRLAVEELGLPQIDALNMDMETFVRGFLQGYPV